MREYTIPNYIYKGVHMLVDLHIHTYFSDGTMSPEEVVKKAKDRDIKILGITDHNKIESWPIFKEAALRENIIPVKGVEINVKHKDKVLHLLGYNFDDSPRLLELIHKADSEMQRMSDDLIINLSKHIDKVSISDYESYNYNVKCGGWKGLHYMFDRGVTTKLFDGFRYYSEYGCGYELYEFPTLKEVCSEIEKAGGYSVLAHPAEYYKNLSDKELVSELEDLRISGINGIECYYPTHDKLMTDTCVEFCNRYKLLITSGSDDHGEFGKEAKVLDQSIGCMNISTDKLSIEKLLKIQ